MNPWRFFSAPLFILSFPFSRETQGIHVSFVQSSLPIPPKFFSGAFPCYLLKIPRRARPWKMVRAADSPPPFPSPPLFFFPRFREQAAIEKYGGNHVPSPFSFFSFFFFPRTVLGGQAAPHVRRSPLCFFVAPSLFPFCLTG